MFKLKEMQRHKSQSHMV